MVEIQNVIRGVVKNKLQKTFNLDEYSRVSHAGEMIKDFVVKQTLHDGNFTIVAVGNANGQNFLGISKRNPKDAYHTVRGEALAMSRAVKLALDSFTR
jgi:hypothetical protein